MTRRLALGLALALAAAAPGCSRDQRTEPESVAPSVLAAPVVAVDVQERIEASGELLAPAHTTVAAEVSGRISEIRIPEGSAVEQGAVVLEIDPQRRQLEVDAARARVAQAQATLAREGRELERVRQLFEARVTSKAKLDEVQTALRLAQARAAADRADLGVAERALADASVQAPFAGLVARRLISIGQFVQPGTALFELVALDPIEVEFHLAEIDSSRVQLGQRIAVRVAPYPDEQFEATVTFVSPTIDPQSRTLRVKGAIPNPAGRLRPGLFARTDLGVALRRGVVMVPEEAVLLRSDGSVLFKLEEGNRVRRLVVQTGLEQRGLIEVRGGVRPGDRVIKRGHAGLIDGALVALRDEEGGPGESGVAAGASGIGTGL
jgi:membrane fusion protein (multidrug efflux system)